MRSRWFGLRFAAIGSSGSPSSGFSEHETTTGATAACAVHSMASTTSCGKIQRLLSTACRQRRARVFQECSARTTTRLETSSFGIFATVVSLDGTLSSSFLEPHPPFLLELLLCAVEFRRGSHVHASVSTAQSSFRARHREALHGCFCGSP